MKEYVVKYITLIKLNDERWVHRKDVNKEFVDTWHIAGEVEQIALVRKGLSNTTQQLGEDEDRNQLKWD